MNWFTLGNARKYKHIAFSDNVIHIKLELNEIQSSHQKVRPKDANHSHGHGFVSGATTKVPWSSGILVAACYYYALGKLSQDLRTPQRYHISTRKSMHRLSHPHFDYILYIVRCEWWFSVIDEQRHLNDIDIVAGMIQYAEHDMQTGLLCLRNRILCIGVIQASVLFEVIIHSTGNMVLLPHGHSVNLEIYGYCYNPHIPNHKKYHFHMWWRCRYEHMCRLDIIVQLLDLKIYVLL